MSRLRALGRSTVGKKAVMAASGVVLAGFVIAHMLGNLQIFAGRARIDAYARSLREAPVLLWSVRALLAAAFVVHVVLALQLAARKRAARPTGYRVRTRDRWAARTMLWTGAAIGVFVAVHLANLTWGLLHPRFEPLAVYDNVVTLFHASPWSAFYVVAVVALGAHIAHGLWSAPTSLGLVPERGAPRLRRLARGAAAAVATGMLAVVLAAAAGALR
jgi:succinate dehydrogenase / fumarate reductase cytochrome b subunit